MHVRPSPLHVLLLAPLLLLWIAFGCQRQKQPGFDLVEPGMTQEQVRAVLGKPSSTFERTVDSNDQLLRVERWQYGDNLSTLMTGAFFSDMPSDSVWSVFFDEDGRVVRIQEPDFRSPREAPPAPSPFEDPINPAIPSRSR